MKLTKLKSRFTDFYKTLDCFIYNMCTGGRLPPTTAPTTLTTLTITLVTPNILCEKDPLIVEKGIL